MYTPILDFYAFIKLGARTGKRPGWMEGQDT